MKARSAGENFALHLRDAAFRRLVALPPDVLRRVAGPPTVLDGQTLDMQVQVMLRALALTKVKMPDDVAESRRQMDDDAQAIAPPRKVMAKERDVVALGPHGPIPIRVYTPKNASPALLVYFHGGGFVSGSIASHEPVLMDIADASGVVIASVDYRLGPEHRFPAALDDAFAAYRWARENAAELGCDPQRIAVGGDSAGGNLAATVCHVAKAERVPPPAMQFLVYPATDWSRSCASHRLFASGFLLDEERTHWFEERYFNRIEERDDPRASPCRYSDFSNLPTALVVTAGFDVLRDEGNAYAAQLEKAGNRVSLVCERSLIHGFLNMTGVIKAAHAASMRIADELRRV